MLFPDLPLALDQVLVGGQGLESHGAAGVEFLGGDADLAAEAEDAAVGEARGGVDIDTSRVDIVHEVLGHLVVLCGDDFGVLARIGLDMVDSLLVGVDDLNGDVVVQVFFRIVLLFGWNGILDQATGALVTVEADPVLLN